MGDRAGSSPVTRTEKRGFGQLPETPFLSVGGDLEPEFKVSASPRSVQNQRPLDVVDPVTRMRVETLNQSSKSSSFHFGPPSTNVHRTLWAGSASVGAEQMSPGHFAVCHPRVETLPQRFKVIGKI